MIAVPLPGHTGPGVAPLRLGAQQLDDLIRDEVVIELKLEAAPEA